VATGKSDSSATLTYAAILFGQVPMRQKRNYDFNVRNERQFVEKLRYIHRDLVKRGLCAALGRD